MWIDLPEAAELLDYVEQFAGPFTPVIGLLLASVVLEYLLAALGSFLDGGSSDEQVDRFDDNWCERRFSRFGKQFRDDGW